MITNNSPEIASGSYIGVPATNNVPTPQVGQSPTYYDYLALLPVILTAATPLILGWKKKDQDDDPE